MSSAGTCKEYFTRLEKAAEKQHRVDVLRVRTRIEQAEIDADAAHKGLLKRLAKVSKQRRKKTQEIAALCATGQEILALIAHSEDRLTAARHEREDYRPPRTKQQARKYTGGLAPGGHPSTAAYTLANERAVERSKMELARSAKQDTWTLHFV